MVDEREGNICIDKKKLDHEFFADLPRRNVEFFKEERSSAQFILDKEKLAS